jgi:hypothetical protein
MMEGIGHPHVTVPPGREPAPWGLIRILKWSAPLVVASVAAAVVMGVRATGGSASAGQAGSMAAGAAQPARGYYCAAYAQSDGQPSDESACRREAEDAIRRRPLNSSDGRLAVTTARRIDEVLGKLMFSCPYAGATACPNGPAAAYQSGGAAPIPMTEQATLVWQALQKSGFHEMVVRIATADDPATRGTILYAVGTGNGCVIGYRRGIRGGGSQRIDGRLPDGTCLTR